MTQVNLTIKNDKWSRDVVTFISKKTTKKMFKVKANKFNLKKKKQKIHSPLEEPFYHEL